MRDSVGAVKIREAPIHRSFDDPRAHELPDRGVLRISGNCTTPIFLKYADHVDQERAVRCRGCPSCLRARQYQWAIRAQWEILMHQRTWMFTGTWAEQTWDHHEAKEEVQRFVKRLRKRISNTPGASPIRYLLLPELHKSGAIHYHGLLHHDRGVTHRMVTDSWTAGFSYSSLVKKGQGAAWYVTKYATKELVGGDTDECGRSRRPRILASRSPTYGGPVIVRDLETVQELVAAQAETEGIQETWRKNLVTNIRRLEAQKRGARTPERIILELTSELRLDQAEPHLTDTGLRPV